MSIWLPPGRWFDIARGCFERGGRTICRRYLISEIPLFVRPGAIIPGQGPCTRLTGGSYRQLVVTAYPGDNGSYRLYEDDGMSVDYQRGQCAWIPIQQRLSRSQRIVTVGKIAGTYKGFAAARSLELRLPGLPPPVEIRVGNR